MSPTTYTYDNGAQETFNLIRGPQTPEGYVVASFKYSDGEVSDGYVSLEWLRNRLDELYPVVSSDRRAEEIASVIRIALDLPEGASVYEMVCRIDSITIDAEGWRSRALKAVQPRPLSTDDITDEMVNRAEEAYMWNDTRGRRAAVTAALVAALTEPDPRPENAEDIQAKVEEWLMTDDGGTLDASQAQSLADYLAEGGYQFVPGPRSYCGLGS